MRWLAFLLLGIISGVATLYALGCWLLGQWPWHFWREALPDMYDGKEPYEQWLVKARHRYDHDYDDTGQWMTKMEQARRLQAKEESGDDGV